jgi:hypothetical protein
MTTSTSPLLAATRRIVELACRAPSVHNTQPWAWRVGRDRIELYADWTRTLPAADPDGRNLVISCGAALHHAQVAAAALGFEAVVIRSPDPLQPRHLATLELTPAEPDPDAAADLRAVELRTTDRSRFTDWPIPDDRLRKVAASITQDGVLGVALTDVADRFRVELLVSRALTHQTHDEDVVAEQRQWVDHGVRDGVPAHAAADPSPLPLNQRSRFAPDPFADGQPEVRIGSDGLLVLATVTDDHAAWLRTGEALSALWLHATTDGLSVVPLSQVIEVDETRQALRFGVLDGTVVPQILVRIGWQEIGISQRPRTPRRPVDDVLLP